MSSFINKALSGGRERIALIGYDSDNKKTEIEIDLVESFDVTNANSISRHTIENDPDKPINAITDHIQPENPTIAMSCIISDNLNLLESAKSFSNKAVSARDKLKQIVKWQSSGTLLTIEGYTVGASGFGKVLNLFKRGIGNFNSDLEEPYYGGTATDKIENVVLGNVQSKNLVSLGNDIQVVLNFQRVYLAEAKQGSKSSVITKEIPKKPEKEPVKVDPKGNYKSDLKKGVEAVQ